MIIKFLVNKSSLTIKMKKTEIINCAAINMAEEYAKKVTSHGK